MERESHWWHSIIIIRQVSTNTLRNFKKSADMMKGVVLMISAWNLAWIVPLTMMIGVLLLAIVSGGPPDDE